MRAHNSGGPINKISLADTCPPDCKTGLLPDCRVGLITLLLTLTEFSSSLPQAWVEPPACQGPSRIFPNQSTIAGLFSFWQDTFPSYQNQQINRCSPWTHHNCLLLFLLRGPLLSIAAPLAKIFIISPTPFSHKLPFSFWNSGMFLCHKWPSLRCFTFHCFLGTLGSSD